MTDNLKNHRRELTPETEDAWHEFNRNVYQDGALDAKTKQLIAVAVAHVTQCPYCIKGHAPAAEREGASQREIMEAIWVAAEMRSGAAVAHSKMAFDSLSKQD